MNDRFSTRRDPAKWALSGILLFLLPVVAPAQGPKQLDIGAANAPLSDRDRMDLAAAVAKHNYALERVVIDRAYKAHPMSAELMIMDGRLSYLEKHVKEAAAALERAERVKPLGNEDRMTLALAYEFTSEPAKARAEVVKLTKADPKNAEYFYLLGRLDQHTNHFAEAIVSLRRATELNQGFMRAYEELGQAQEALGQNDEARKTYALAAFRNRFQPSRWEWSPADYGTVLMKDGDLDQAEKLFRESLRYNPGFAWGHYYLGQVFQKRGKDNDALAEYMSAVVHDSSLKQAWLGLGRIYTRLGKQADADRALAIFKQLDDRDVASREKKP